MMENDSVKKRKIPINWEKIERDFLNDDFEMGVMYYFNWINLKEAIDEMEDVNDKILTLKFIKKIVFQYLNLDDYSDLIKKIDAETEFLEKESCVSNTQVNSIESKIDSIMEKKKKSENDNKKKRIPVPPKIKRLLQKEIHSKCPFCPSEDVDQFEIHHIDGNRNNNEISNLIMVCPTCHSKIEKKDITKENVISIKHNFKINN
ncbi:MAG TPA: HNH endonuclease [Ignavibacteria bacterium]